MQRAVLPDHDFLPELLERFSNFFIEKSDLIRQRLDQSVNVVAEEATDQVTDVSVFSSFTLASLKEVEEIIKPSPTKSYKHVTLHRTFLDQFKLAHVRPLIKKPSLDSNTLNNYRPVSNLSYVSKVIENVVASRLRQPLMDSNLYEVIQSTYRPGHSVETALVRVANDLLCSVDKRQAVILVLLDLCAAFDNCGPCHLAARSPAEDWCVWNPTGLIQTLSGGEEANRQHWQHSVLGGQSCLWYPAGVCAGSHSVYLLHKTSGRYKAHKHRLQLHLFTDDTQL